MIFFLLSSFLSFLYFGIFFLFFLFGDLGYRFSVYIAWRRELISYILDIQVSFGYSII